MKSALFVALAIPACTLAVPTVTPTRAALSQTNVAAAKTLAPIPVVVAGNGIVKPGPDGLAQSLDSCASGHADNMEIFPTVTNDIDPQTSSKAPVATPNARKHRHGTPTFRGGLPMPFGMGHGPVVHSGFRTAALGPQSTISVSSGTSGALKVPTVTAKNHRHPIGSRDLNNSNTTSDQVIKQDEEADIQACTNNSAKLSKLISQAYAVRSAINRKLAKYCEIAPSRNGTAANTKDVLAMIDQRAGRDFDIVHEAWQKRISLCAGESKVKSESKALSTGDLEPARVSETRKAWLEAGKQVLGDGHETYEDPVITESSDYRRLLAALEQQMDLQGIARPLR